MLAVLTAAQVAAGCDIAPLVGRVECGRLDRAVCQAAVATAERFLPAGHAPVVAIAADDSCPPRGRACLRYNVADVRAVSVVVAYADGSADTFALSGPADGAFDEGWLHDQFVPAHVGALIGVEHAAGRDIRRLPLAPAVQGLEGG